MQKQPEIAWRQSQINKLRRTVQKFNAKLTRDLKRNPQLKEYLPERANVADLKQSIKSADQLNKFVASVERAFKPGAFAPVETEKGIKTTVWEINETKLRVRAINRERAKISAKINPSTTAGTMGTIEANNLKPRKFNINSIKEKDWDKYVKGVEKEYRQLGTNSAAENYKNRYLFEIRKNLGAAGDKLYYLILSMDADLIYNTYYDDPVLSIGFTSDPLPAQDIADKAYLYWSEVIDLHNLELQAEAIRNL